MEENRVPGVAPHASVRDAGEEGTPADLSALPGGSELLPDEAEWQAVERVSDPERPGERDAERPAPPPT